MNVDSTITPAYTGAVSHDAEHPDVTFQHQQQEQSTLEIDSARSQTTSLSSGRLADLQAIEDAADTRFIVQWQEKTVDTSHASGSSTVQAAYRSCMDAYYDGLPIWLSATECDEESRRKLYRNYVLLREWGMSYSVSQGQLDHLPSEAEELIETICSFLNELVEILVHRIPGLGDGGPKLHEATPDPKGSLHDQLNQRELIESRSTELFQETWSQCTDEICSYVELLGELHPTIESWVPVHELGPSPEPGEQSIDGAFSYSNLVRTKFQHAPMELTISLGELNYERYLRLLQAREANSGQGREFQGFTSDRAKSDSFHDTDLGTSIPYASTAPPSIAQTLAGESRARFPSLPRAADAGPFTCDFCGDTVFFGTTRDYRKHLLQDLQPYSCLETACSRDRRVFSSRKSWIEHLKADHDLQPESPHRQCQLCMDMTGKGMLEICKHYANHLEDIALASAQAFMISDNDLASNSDESIGDEAVQMEEEDENWSPPSPGEDASLPMVPENSADLIEAPNCAICNGPAYPECPCEGERLQIAVKQAEQRAMDEKLATIRDWVTSHSRRHILKAFETLVSLRTKGRDSRIQSLDNYDVYMRYSGCPPIPPAKLSALQSQIAEAHAEHKRGIDADWRACVLRYPVVLDYFYSLTEIRLPGVLDFSAIQKRLDDGWSTSQGQSVGGPHVDHGYMDRVTRKKTADVVK